MMDKSTFAATTLVGFDSAWADRVPGAICAMVFDKDGEQHFEPPRSARFDAATDFIEDLATPDRKIVVAIDQPIIVPYDNRARPCEKVVGSVMGWVGGGIQSSYRRKSPQTLFGETAPIWRFLDELGFSNDPEQGRLATAGGFVMEVFPALTLLGLEPEFTRSKGAPCYNPRGKRFEPKHWRAVCDTVTKACHELHFEAAAEWCDTLDRDAKPKKALQDHLDAVVCLVTAAIWLVDRPRA